MLCSSEYVPLFVKLAQQVVKKYSSEINKDSNEVEKTLPNHSWDTCRRSELAQHTHPTHLNFVFNLKSRTLGVCCYEAWQCLLGRPVTGWHSSQKTSLPWVLLVGDQKFRKWHRPLAFSLVRNFIPSSFLTAGLLICNFFTWTCLIDTFWWVAWTKSDASKHEEGDGQRLSIRQRWRRQMSFETWRYGPWSLKKCVKVVWERWKVHESTTSVSSLY